MLKVMRFKMWMATCLFIIGIGSTSFAAGRTTKYVYDFNSRCKQAYQALISLRIAEGNELLRAELKENPSNLIPYTRTPRQL
jgi:hypothetical protein